MRAGARKALFERTVVAEWAKARTYSSIPAELPADATAKERCKAWVDEVDGYIESLRAERDQAERAA